MTREEAVKAIKSHCYFANLVPVGKEALDIAIKALEQQPCDDAISRKWTLDVVNNFVFDTETDRNRIIHIVRDTSPSVIPKQKQEPILGKIRDEICEYNNNTWKPEGSSLGNAGWWACNKCIEIIDKYKAESEETFKRGRRFAKDEND